MVMVARRRQLEKNLRLSSRVLKVEIALAAIGSAVVWLLYWQFRFPVAVGTFLTFLASFAAAGDWLNILYCRRELRKLDGDDEVHSGILRNERPPVIP